MINLQKTPEVEAKIKESKDKRSDSSEVEGLMTLLRKLQTEDGIYMQPMLVDQISYLYSMLIRADQKPGKDAYERFEELTTQFNDMQAEAE